MAVKSCDDASRMAPRPVAESAKYIALALRMPHAAPSPARLPLPSTWPTTSSTAGPGVSESSVSVAQKRSQVWSVTVISSGRRSVRQEVVDDLHVEGGLIDERHVTRLRDEAQGRSLDQRVHLFRDRGRHLI